MSRRMFACLSGKANVFGGMAPQAPYIGPGSATLVPLHCLSRCHVSQEGKNHVHSEKLDVATFVLFAQLIVVCSLSRGFCVLCVFTLL